MHAVSQFPWPQHLLLSVSLFVNCGVRSAQYFSVFKISGTRSRLGTNSHFSKGRKIASNF